MGSRLRRRSALELGVRFESEQVFGAVDVEFGAGHGQADQPVDVPAQQETRAMVAAQLVQFTKTPAWKDGRYTHRARVLRGGDRRGGASPGAGEAAEVFGGHGSLV